MTANDIKISTRDDLRATYLLAFDSFSTDPVEVADHIGQNTRYARELLGVLTTAKLLDSDTVNEGGEVWQVINPGTYDDHERDEAVAVIDAWLNDQIPVKEKKMTATASKSTSRLAAAPTGKCLCGCGENVAKSSYRPGHDARHAGNVAREIAANYATKGFDRREVLAALPSEALKAKAEAMAERLTAKAEAKAQRAATKPTKQAKPEPQLVQAKVGRHVYEGEVVDGVFTYKSKAGETKTAAKFTILD